MCVRQSTDDEIDYTIETRAYTKTAKTARGEDIGVESLNSN